MNWKTLFFVTLLAWAATVGYFLYTCKPGSITPPSTCELERPLDTMAVRAQIKAYQNLLQMVSVQPKDSASKIVVNGDSLSVADLASEINALRGYKLPSCELEAIINADGEQPTVYVMFAVNPEAGKRGSTPIKYLDIYFQVITTKATYLVRSVSNAASVNPDDDFFDFPQPCPSSCPD